MAEQLPPSLAEQLPLEVTSLVISYLGLPDFLACLRVSREFRTCALYVRPSAFAVAAAALEEVNSFDVCTYCNERRCRKAACAEDCSWRWAGDAAEAAANAGAWRPDSLLRSDPRRRPAYAAQPPQVRLREMVRFTRACVLRLRRHFVRQAELIAGHHADKGHKRAWIVGEVAKLSASREDLFLCDSSVYWFRHDECEGEIFEQLGSSLEMAMDEMQQAAYFLDGDERAGKELPAMVGVVPGSDQHIESMLQPTLRAEEARLVAVFGEAVFERDYCIMAAARGAWRRFVKDAL